MQDETKINKMIVSHPHRAIEVLAGVVLERATGEEPPADAVLPGRGLDQLVAERRAVAVIAHLLRAHALETAEKAR